MSLVRYGRILAVAAVFNAAIVLTGALVRLTNSGLGCVDWPGCSEEEFVPAWSFHSWIEYGNRLFSFPVAVASIAVLWATLRLDRRSTAALRLAWAIPLGVAAQAIIGAVVVRALLSPIWVSVHFLGSMLILAAIVALWFVVRRDHEVDPEPVGVEPRLAWSVAGLASLVLVTGTVVTGTGPNSGDADAVRWSLELTTVTQVHSVSAWLLAAAVVAAAVLTRGRADARLPRLLLALVVAQGGIGYLQYALGVPAGLVAAHITGAVLVWLASLWQLGRALEASAGDRADEPRAAVAV